MESILYSHSEALTEILYLLRGETTLNTNSNINNRGTTLNYKYNTPSNKNIINDTTIQRISDEQSDMDKTSSHRIN